MAAKNTPIDMHLIDDQIAQPGQKILPLGVIGQNGRVQHVRVGDDQPALLADGSPLGSGRIAVVGGDLREVERLTAES